MPPDAFGPLDEDEEGVWPQNEEALRLYLSIETQQRWIKAGEQPVFLGLDYAGARAGIRAAGLKLTPALWADVQVIEAAAVAAVNRKIR